MQRLFDKVLVPLDGSPVALRALPHAERLADMFDSQLWLVTVDDPDDAEACPARVLEEARAECDRVVTAEVVPGTDPASVIATLNDRDPRTLCCMSTRGRHPLAQTLLGRTAREVVDRADEPVVLVGPQCRIPSRPIDRIVLALDGSTGSEVAIAWVELWARAAQVALDVIRVVHPLPPPAARVVPSAQQMEDLHYVHQVRDLLATGPADVRSLTVQATDPVEVLRSHASDFGDSILAMATRPGSALQDAILGTVAGELVRRSPVPVALTSRPDRR